MDDKKKESMKELDDKLNNLNVKAKQKIDRMPVFEVIFNYTLALLVANYLGWSLGVMGNTIVFVFVTNFIAPRLADALLKKRVNRYVVRNYEKMLKKGKGTVNFFLYNHRYQLTWNSEETVEQ